MQINTGITYYHRNGDQSCVIVVYLYTHIHVTCDTTGIYLAVEALNLKRCSTSTFLITHELCSKKRFVYTTILQVTGVRNQMQKTNTYTPPYLPLIHSFFVIPSKPFLLSFPIVVLLPE